MAGSLLSLAFRHILGTLLPYPVVEGKGTGRPLNLAERLTQRACCKEELVWYDKTLWTSPGS